MKRFRRVLWCSVVVLSAITGCSGNAPSGGGTPPPTSTPAGGTSFFEAPVPIGVKYDQPGFGIENRGDYSGFDIDLARYLAQQIHFPPNSFVQIRSDQDRPSGLGSSYKMVIATYSITSDRKNGLPGQPGVDFVGPYLKTPVGLLVKQGSRYDHANPSLSGARVCTLPGSTPNEIPLPPDVIRVTNVRNYSDCVRDVESDAADAMLTDSLIDYGYARDRDYPGLAVQNTQYGGVKEITCMASLFRVVR